MEGALQNAITLLLRLGWNDAEWAAHRMYRREAAPSPSSWFDDDEPQEGTAFQNALTVSDAKYIFETLEVGHMIVRTGSGSPLLLQTPLLPDATLPKSEIDRIEDLYAQALYEPIPQKTEEPVADSPSATEETKSRKRAKRRIDE
jgi:hypothetical protein